MDSFRTKGALCCVPLLSGSINIIKNDIFIINIYLYLPMTSFSIKNRNRFHEPILILYHSFLGENDEYNFIILIRITQILPYVFLPNHFQCQLMTLIPLYSFP